MALVGALAGLMLAPGCEDLRCCNSCGRTYSVGDPLAYPGVTLVGIEEGGNECEIDDVPRMIPDGLHTLVVRIAHAEPAGPAEDSGMRVEVEVLQHFEGDVAASECAGLPTLSATELTQQERAIGDTVCLVDEVSAEASCTQKGCALGD